MTSVRKPASAPAGSFEYQLQRSPVGVVVLDVHRRIVAVNAVARRLLSVDSRAATGTDILSLHPPAARAKVRWLIDAAENAADGTASMVVATPMGSLVAKVTQLVGDQGFCMMFHALGGHAMMEEDAARRPHLLKLPIHRGSATALIDIADVVCLIAQGHYSRAVTLTADCFCSLPLSELERRVDPLVFVRVHRGHLVNLRHVLSAERVDGRWSLAMAGSAALRVPVGRDKVDLVRRLLAV